MYCIATHQEDVCVLCAASRSSGENEVQVKVAAIDGQKFAARVHHMEKDYIHRYYNPNLTGR